MKYMFHITVFVLFCIMLIAIIICIYIQVLVQSIPFILKVLRSFVGYDMLPKTLSYLSTYMHTCVVLSVCAFNEQLCIFSRVNWASYPTGNVKKASLTVACFKQSIFNIYSNMVVLTLPLIYI